MGRCSLLCVPLPGAQQALQAGATVVKLPDSAVLAPRDTVQWKTSPCRSVASINASGSKPSALSHANTAGLQQAFHPFASNASSSEKKANSNGLPFEHERTGKVTNMNPGGWKMMRTPALCISEANNVGRRCFLKKPLQGFRFIPFLQQPLEGSCLPRINDVPSFHAPMTRSSTVPCSISSTCAGET